MNQTDKYSQRAMNGAALAPLNNRQKARICILARQAYERQRSEVSDQMSENRPPLAEKLFCCWRRQQQNAAVGKSHLTDCRNADYLTLKAHFLDLAGETVAAFRNHLRAGTEPRAWALARLRKECQAAADVLPGAWDYAAGFLRNKRGLSIDDCSERDLWHAIFLVRRRAAQLRRNPESRTLNTEPQCVQ